MPTWTVAANVSMLLDSSSMLMSPSRKLRMLMLTGPQYAFSRRNWRRERKKQTRIRYWKKSVRSLKLVSIYCIWSAEGHKLNHPALFEADKQDSSRENSKFSQDDLGWLFHNAYSLALKSLDFSETEHISRLLDVSGKVLPSKSLEIYI